MMNKTDKLLRAFIEASEFEVERTVDITYGQIIKAGLWGCSAATNKEFDFFPATSDMPDAEYREVIRTTNYKLTKKDGRGLLQALERCIEIIDSDRSYVEPEILAAFKKAGGSYGAN